METTIKKRTIQVGGLTCEGCNSRITDELKKMDGINQVSADNNGTVQVEYNLRKTNLKNIEETIENLGYTTSAGLLERIKRGWINFTEQNEFDNIAHPSTSCCSIPPAWSAKLMSPLSLARTPIRTPICPLP